MSLDLPLIWAGIIAVAVLLYVMLDGVDLGVGILFPMARNRADRDVMIDTIAPVWDGNETWLVLGGGGLFAAFPGGSLTATFAQGLILGGFIQGVTLKGGVFAGGQLGWLAPYGLKALLPAY